MVMVPLYHKITVIIGFILSSCACRVRDIYETAGKFLIKEAVEPPDYFSPNNTSITVRAGSGLQEQVCLSSLKCLSFSCRLM